MHFSDLGLAPELLRALEERGYTTPTPIQQQAIPAVLGGHDVLAGAQTGTGKTAGFVLPLLQKLGKTRAQQPRVLVLTPTRELAAQVADSAKRYGAYMPLRVGVIFGGVSERPQMDMLRMGCDILVATPGRLLDLCTQKVADLSHVAHFVLDEADRMLDMGFIRDIRRIIKLLPAQRQNLMFSATYSDDIRQLAEGLLRRPVEIEVASRNRTADRVDQVAYRVPKDHKRHLLVHLFRHGVAGEGPWEQVLVFTRTKHGANRLAEQLEGAGILAAAIHGNKSQGARVRALEDFKANRITALVATEVASRGLDIKALPHVVNYELPNVPEDYVHRIGRTARAGAEGSAVSLVAPDEAGLLRDIERTMKQSVPIAATPQFEIINAPAAPPRRPAAAHAAGAAVAAHGAGRASQRSRTRSQGGTSSQRAGSAPHSAYGDGRPDGGGSSGRSGGHGGGGHGGRGRGGGGGASRGGHSRSNPSAATHPRGARTAGAPSGGQGGGRPGGHSGGPRRGGGGGGRSRGRGRGGR